MIFSKIKFKINTKNMKKFLIISSTFFISTFAFSQTGVNTWNPQGVFNVDGGKDNPPTGAPSPTQQLNDVTVLANGNMGVGTTSPSQKLEIQTGGTAIAPVTGFKLVDGNQANTLALTSDANGVGTWKPIALPGIKGTFGGSNIASDKNTTGTTYKDSGAYITLPKGTWAVNFGATLISAQTGTNKFWMHARVTSDKTNLNGVSQVGFTPNLPGGLTLCAGNIFSSYNMIQGSKVFTVTADSVTLYIFFDNTDNSTQPWTFSPGNWENYLYATRLNIN